MVTCHAGGVTNFAKLGYVTTHKNYGLSCVPVKGKQRGELNAVKVPYGIPGAHWYQWTPTISCLYCGRDMTGEPEAERQIERESGEQDHFSFNSQEPYNVYMYQLVNPIMIKAEEAQI